MSPSRTWRPAFLAVATVLVAAALFAAPAPAQAPSREQIQQFAVGTQALRWILKREGFKPIADESQLANDPGQTVLIVLGGDLGWLNRVPGGVTSFVERGGALLAASDRHSRGEINDLSPASITGILVSYPIGSTSGERGQRDRPFLKATEDKHPDGSVNPFTGLKVATNIPSYLSEAPTDSGVTPLARFDQEVDYRRVPGVSPRKEPLCAAAGQRGDGRFVVLADHSVFINEMLLDKECDNLDLTVRLLQWLSAGGQRKQAMLVEDGRILSNFDVPLKPLPPPPPLEVLLEMLKRRDEVVDAAQREIGEKGREQGLDRAVTRAFVGKDGDGVPRIKRYALWLIGGCLAALALYRFGGEGRFRHETDLPLLAPAVARQRPAVSALEQRQRAQVESGNLWESARELARRRLGPPAGPGLPPEKPRVVAGTWWRRRTAEARLRRIWDIAYGPAPVRVRPADWELFLFDLDALKRDVADGTVRLPSD
jgi:hypothetical protein